MKEFIIRVIEIFLIVIASISAIVMGVSVFDFVSAIFDGDILPEKHVILTLGISIIIFSISTISAYTIYEIITDEED